MLGGVRGMKVFRFATPGSQAVSARSERSSESRLRAGGHPPAAVGCVAGRAWRIFSITK